MPCIKSLFFQTHFKVVLVLLLSSSCCIISVQIFLNDVHLEPSKDSTDVTKELASNLETMGLYEYAVKFYLMIGNVANHNDVSNSFASFHLSPTYEWKG